MWLNFLNCQVHCLIPIKQTAFHITKYSLHVFWAFRFLHNRHGMQGRKSLRYFSDRFYCEVNVGTNVSSDALPFSSSYWDVFIRLYNWTKPTLAFLVENEHFLCSSLLWSAIKIFLQTFISFANLQLYINSLTELILFIYANCCEVYSV